MLIHKTFFCVLTPATVHVELFVCVSIRGGCAGVRVS